MTPLSPRKNFLVPVLKEAIASRAEFSELLNVGSARLLHHQRAGHLFDHELIVDKTKREGGSKAR